MGQYYSNEDLTSNLQLHEFTFENKIYKFYTDNGVFSKSSLDFGTSLLLESLVNLNLSGKALDLGCGYGAIAIILGTLKPNLTFEGVDLNKRAVHLAKMNQQLNKLPNLKFYESDVYSDVKGKFNYIITNPPIRAGKKTVYKFLFEAQEHLEKNGTLYLVLRKQQGAKTIIRDLEKEYKIEILNKTKGFFIISCKTFD